ncbi:cytochrome c oxidase assembly protein COX19 isoform X2 [Tenrec ecaudatus]|uniref:cytochrome c oxidase assembly protein COX19 isoform X2 n=1 Tax=Tenrec ecaudatus TaxID=94439 RepID=UPI003F5954D7
MRSWLTQRLLGARPAVLSAAPACAARRFPNSQAIMSTAMNFGTKSFQPRPPDKGSFPLDHLGECKRFQEKFMKCLRDSHFESARCRSESKDYLECRMESGRALTTMGPTTALACPAETGLKSEP